MPSLSQLTGLVVHQQTRNAILLNESDSLMKFNDLAESTAFAAAAYDKMAEAGFICEGDALLGASDSTDFEMYEQYLYTRR